MRYYYSANLSLKTRYLMSKNPTQSFSNNGIFAPSRISVGDLCGQK